jgi:glycosyltransferase involved in cell wall biosynthesis
MRILSRPPGDQAGRRRVPHLLAIVENVPFCVDTRLRKQVDSLLERGYRVTVITRRDERHEVYRGITGLRLVEYSSPPDAADRLGYVIEYGRSLLAAIALSLQVCLRERVDVVQLCQPPDLYFPLAWLLRAIGCKILIDQRDLMPELYAARFGREGRLMERLFQRLARWNHRSAHAVICVNGHLEGYALATGANPSTVAIVRNGPVLSRVARAVAAPALKRGATHLCCWTGKMGRQDRLDLLLAVTDRLVHRLGRTDWHLAILGDGECLEEMRTDVARLGLERWVTFTGWVSEEEVFRYLATSDVGLDASLQVEVSPVKVMEYMGAGLPVVAFDLPETRTVAEGAAVLVPPGDVDALAEAVNALLEDPQRRATMGRNGRERIAGELAWEHQAIAYLEVVDRMARIIKSGNRRSDRIPA